MKPLRQTIFAFVTLVAAALLAAGATWSQEDALRIGFLSVRSGPLAAGGKQMEEGIQLFLKERNNTLGGRKVESKDGQLVNTIVETFPEVSQFWTYDIKGFLANPAYSRDVPAAKFIE